MFRFEQLYSYAPMRSHGISQYSFLVYLLGLRNRVTVTFWTSLPLANLSAYYAFVPSFCPSGYDFAIPSSRLHLTMQTLGVAFGLVGNYLPVDFHHRALTCPSYQKERQPDFFGLPLLRSVYFCDRVLCVPGICAVQFAKTVKVFSCV